MNTEYFQYGKKEVDHLKKKDQVLGAAMDRIGIIKRPVIPDLFCALMHAIIGQQISTKAQETIWKRLLDLTNEVNAGTILSFSDTDLQSIGLTFRKVDYIKNMAQKVANKELRLDELSKLNDDEVCLELSALKGIGTWTAEMIMLFSMQRMNVLSYGDLAIHRGMRMLYHHRAIRPKLFNKYWHRYSPYASVASLYLWAIAGGAIPEMRDYAPKKNK